MPVPRIRHDELGPPIFRSKLRQPVRLLSPAITRRCRVTELVLGKNGWIWWWQLKDFWNFHPEPWGRFCHFDGALILNHWVGEKPPTTSDWFGSGKPLRKMMEMSYEQRPLKKRKDRLPVFQLSIFQGTSCQIEGGQRVGNNGRVVWFGCDACFIGAWLNKWSKMKIRWIWWNYSDLTRPIYPQMVV